MFDWLQSDINRQLKNLTGDNVGLLGLIPKEWRQAGQGFATALADPLENIADFFQNQTNQIVKDFAQTSAGSEAKTLSQAELEEATEFFAE